MYLILEDDVRFSDDFKERWSAVRQAAEKDHSWDILFLGNLDDRDFYGDEPDLFAPSLLLRLAPQARPARPYFRPLGTYGRAPCTPVS